MTSTHAACRRRSYLISLSSDPRDFDSGVCAVLQGNLPRTAYALTPTRCEPAMACGKARWGYLGHARLDGAASTEVVL
jgi:hypothetical protein